MQSRYDETDAARIVEEHRTAAPARGVEANDDLALRVYTSRLLGAEPELVLHGGGNTSVKSVEHELTGERVDVLFVKGSGWDLASIEAPGFPACRLAALQRALGLVELSDEHMVQYVRSQMLDPASPTPSVEALLHADLPGKFVDHTHADAVLAVVDQPDGAERAREVWGEQAVFVPYVMPGFLLAKRVTEFREAIEQSHVMVLDKHGIFTWGATARQSYERMIEAVTAAEAYLQSRSARGAASGAVAAPDVGRADAQRALTPSLRGALQRAPGGRRWIVRWRDEPEILALLETTDASALTRGPITPDHVIRTRPWPLVGADLAELAHPGKLATARERIERHLESYADRYRGYVERARQARQRDVAELDAQPRVIAVPGLGAACLGATAKDADTVGDLYLHTARVILDAERLGRYQPVSELDLFDVEYWSLEQAKLERSGRSEPLARRVALVTGGAGGIGLATAERLLELGAHVVLGDRDADKLAAAERELSGRWPGRVASFVCDVTQYESAEATVGHAVSRFGGLDLLVSNAGTAPGGQLHEAEGAEALLPSLEVNLLGHQHLARAVTEVLLQQGTGGVLLFNASKSAFNQGPGFGPYAVPKAALVALMRQYAVDLGQDGIRANAVNADRVRTALFDSGVLEARARARGLSPDQYFEQNLLHRETLARDVADAFAWLALAEATTGCVVTVDGGNPAAFVR